MDPVHHGSIVSLEEFSDSSLPDDPLARKARRLCQSHMDEGFLRALSSMELNITKFSAGERHHSLVQDQEKLLLEQQRKFRNEMQSSLMVLSDHKASVNNFHQKVGSRIEEVKNLKSKSSDFMNSVRVVDSDVRAIQLKQKILKKFLERFRLTSEEIQHLSSSSQHLDSEFFGALKRCQQIREDCTLLLRQPSASQVAGLQFMEAAAQYQEKGFQRLFRWCMEDTRSFSSEFHSPSEDYCTALSVLEQHPTLLKSVLDEYASVRKSYITASFIDALTQGTSTGARPLELHSYDSVRYATDMLGWIHQAFASEKDHWMLLTRSVSEAARKEGQSRAFDILFEGIERPLKSRFERLLVSEQDLINLYRIYYWIDFYVTKIRLENAGLDEEVGFVKQLKKLGTSVHTRYLQQLRNLTSQMTGKVEVPPDTLEPSQSLTSVLLVLRDLKAAQQSLWGREDRQAETDTSILGVVMEPLLQLIHDSASHVTPSTPTAAAIYIVNCLHLVRTLLLDNTSSDSRGDFLNRQSDAHIDTLINSVTANVITEIRMRPMFDWLKYTEETGTEQIPDIFAEEFITFFDRFLANPDGFITPQVDRLLCPRTKDKVFRTTKTLIADYYRQIHKLVMRTKLAEKAKSPDVVDRLLNVGR